MAAAKTLSPAGNKATDETINNWSKPNMPDVRLKALDRAIQVRRPLQDQPASIVAAARVFEAYLLGDDHG